MSVCLLLLAGCVNTSDVVSKSDKAINKIKSGQTTFILKNTQGSTKSQTVDTGTFIMNPFKVQIDQTTQDQQSSPYYIENNVMYLKMGKKWFKNPVKSSDQTVKNVKGEMVGQSAITAVKGLQDDLKAKKSGNRYILSYKGSSKKAKKIAKQVLADQLGGSKTAVQGIQINKFSINYQVNNKNYLPEKSIVKIDYENSQSKVKASTEADGTYSSLNKINDVSVPNDVKTKAKKIPKNIANFLF